MADATLLFLLLAIDRLLVYGWLHETMVHMATLVRLLCQSVMTT